VWTFAATDGSVCELHAQSGSVGSGSDTTVAPFRRERGLPMMTVEGHMTPTHKRPWGRPGLVVIARTREENVLDFCKAEVLGSGSHAQNSACRLRFTGCVGACGALGAS
jgi:hypothetical protein